MGGGAPIADIFRNRGFWTLPLLFDSVKSEKVSGSQSLPDKGRFRMMLLNLKTAPIKSAKNTIHTLVWRIDAANSNDDDDDVKEYEEETISHD